MINHEKVSIFRKKCNFVPRKNVKNIENMDTMVLVEKERKVRTINVASLISDRNYIADDEDGQRVYEFIKKAFSENRKVVLSFQNVKNWMGAAFCHAAIGQLYKDYSDDEIKENLRIENMSDLDRRMLKRTVDMANLYYNNPEAYQELQKKIDNIFED
jgi:hypothetical protein